MYDGCFGLNRRPFTSVPQADQYFPAGTIENARTTLARCIQRGEGAGLVIGPSGTGKTLLFLTLADQFRRSFQVAMLASGRLSTRRALFQAILYELGRPYRYMDEGELRLAVVDYLTSSDDASRGMLLLVDEAHTLPLRLLEEIRLLSNVARNGQSLVRLVLAGGAALEERFASPKLDSFSQRLSARCYLEVLNRTETQDYIRWQIDSAGGLGEEVFCEEACQSVFQATGGVPRLINQVCDHALLLAYVAGRKTVEPANIEEAWADLQQLPTPWSGNAPKSGADDGASGGVIEFGSLDDSPETPGASNAGSAVAAESPRVFRVASIEEDFEEGVEITADDAAPSEQITRIKQLLAEAEDDFQPAGSIGPEIELHFEEEAVHPFREEFEHEEIVADRYAVKPAAVQPLAQVSGVQEAEKVEEVRTVCEEPEPVYAAAAVASAPSVAVLESESDGKGPPPTSHHEYRRLFAKLRRG
jgi:type II secretory pathway predicted ATPase ExeA